MPSVSRQRRYDLMLTPQFYIFKKEPLPVKYTYQAVKLAPSILDELTGDGEYSYAAIKEEDGWALIAYDMAKIEAFLEGRGVAKQQINKIYFAQQSKEHFKYPVSVDEKNALVTVDDTVVMLPKSIVGEEECGILTNAFRPDKGITPSQSRSSFITQKHALLIALFLLLLAAAFLAEGIRYQRAIASVEQQLEEAKSRFPQLQNKSSMVLRSLYASNHTVDTEQRRIRDTLKSISRLTSKASKIDKLKVDTQGYEVTIATDKEHLAELKKYARSKKLLVGESNSSLLLKGSF